MKSSGTKDTFDKIMALCAKLSQNSHIKHEVNEVKDLLVKFNSATD